MGYVAVDDGIAALRRGQPVLVEAGPTAVLVARPGHGLLARLAAGRSIVSTSGLLELGGTIRRADPNAVALDLLRLSDLDTLAYGTLVDVPPRLPVASFAARVAADHDLALMDASDIAHHRWRHETLVEQMAVAHLPLPEGDFRAHAFRSRLTGVEHLALVMGDIDTDAPVLCRVHSECVTGDILGSLRCDCGEQLAAALMAVAAAGRGVVVYLRGHEGRGIGLGEKLRAYALQEQGHDTYDANVLLGHPPDGRDFGDAAQILRLLRVGPVRLLTNNPAKLARLDSLGITVDGRVPLVIEPNPHNEHYIDTKRRRFGHL